MTATTKTSKPSKPTPTSPSKHRTPKATSEPAAEQPAETLGLTGARTVLFRDIELNPNNPRTDAATTNLTGLCNSILEKGILQPLIVRNSPNPGKVQLIAGERRLLAYQKNIEDGKATENDPIPVIHKGELSDLEAFEIAVIENEAREQMNPADRLGVFQNMLKMGSTIERIASHFAADPLEVSKWILVSEQADEDTLQALRSGEITLAQAFVIASSSSYLHESLLKQAKNGTGAQELKNLTKRGEIPLSAARFPIELYQGQITQPIFEGLPEAFADRPQFFKLQQEHAEKLAESLKDQHCWVNIEIGTYFSTYGSDYCVAPANVPVKTGAVIFISTTTGELTIHKGLMTKEEHKVHTRLVKHFEREQQKKTAGQNPSLNLPEKAMLYPFHVRSERIQTHLRDNPRELQTWLLLGFAGCSNVRVRVSERPKTGMTSTPAHTESAQALQQILPDQEFTRDPFKHTPILLSFRDHKNMLDLYEKLWLLDDNTFAQVFAHVMSGLVSDHNEAFQGYESSPVITRLFHKAGLSEGAYFELDEAYLKTLNRSHILALVKTMPPEVHLHLHPDMKRSAMVELVLKAAPKLRELGWMPEGFQVDPLIPAASLEPGFTGENPEGDEDIPSEDDSEQDAA